MHKEGMLLQEKLLKLVILIGLAITVIGSSLNILLGLPAYSIIHHLLGVIVLITSWGWIQRKGDPQSVSIFVLSYYCFVFTPFNWIFLNGIHGNTFYIAFVFVVLIILLLSNRVSTILLSFYMILLAGISGWDVVKVVSFQDSLLKNELLLNIISFFVMTGTLVYILYAFRNRFDLQQDRLYELAIRDYMTNAYNLRYMEDTIQKYCKRLGKKETFTFSLAISDLDNFKEINDTHGHSVGNDVIVSFYNCLRDTIGNRGIVGRLGGDEFIIIFPGIDKEEAARSLAELKGLSNHKINSIEIVPPTMSIGVCDSREHQTLEGLLQLADQRLYKAKELGRDTIVAS